MGCVTRVSPLVTPGGTAFRARSGRRKFLVVTEVFQRDFSAARPAARAPPEKAVHVYILVLSVLCAMCVFGVLGADCCVSLAYCS